MDKQKTTKSDMITEALRVATEGLQSMQKLQLQTAETHRKFLDTQAEASRALQEMMVNTQRLSQILIGNNANHNKPFTETISNEPSIPLKFDRQTDPSAIRCHRCS